MNLAVAHEMAAQVVKMTYEQSGGTALVGEPLSHDHCSRAPVEGARQVAFLVGARRGDRHFWPRRIHMAPILGLVLISTSSWKTAISLAGNVAKSWRRACSLASRWGSVGPTTGRGRRHTSCSRC